MPAAGASRAYCHKPKGDARRQSASWMLCWVVIEFSFTACIFAAMADKVQQEKREERLAAQLRANLARRKAQARARRAGERDTRPDGLAVAPAVPSTKDGKER